jgi:hypothetical protein
LGRLGAEDIRATSLVEEDKPSTGHRGEDMLGWKPQLMDLLAVPYFHCFHCDFRTDSIDVGYALGRNPNALKVGGRCTQKSE